MLNKVRQYLVGEIADQRVTADVKRVFRKIAAEKIKGFDKLKREEVLALQLNTKAKQKHRQHANHPRIDDRIELTACYS